MIAVTTNKNAMCDEWPTVTLSAITCGFWQAITIATHAYRLAADEKRGLHETTTA